jgi:hypothetical protein
MEDTFVVGPYAFAITFENLAASSDMHAIADMVTIDGDCLWNVFADHPTYSNLQTAMKCGTRHR